MTKDHDTLVIAGWAGIGKTELARKYSNALDLESSPYYWDYVADGLEPSEQLKGTKGRTLNSEWPKNYINAIKENIGKYAVIMVWCNEKAFPHYESNGIDYTLCYPDADCAPEYEQRYLGRGNQEGWAARVSGLLSLRIQEYEQMSAPKIVLHSGDTLESRLLELGYPLIVKEEVE